ncbi:proline dehydrogenase family protein [Staphylococcus hyicus]|uniref:Proline dehydrogenase family protein n=2 Tax=Staphylococcus hyicus TaxID=1284 RepID=A0ACD5FN81_STAHY|nr:proline dehydrogenase family protein [Staphylococcus hyicus]AJC95902.1 proline dehydrogenase [Staphylococcus hyicus]MCE5154558.1 proline dehydrogenase family protein [Staphylococcus hyicus]MCQ9291086.1 proline dehydrogenase family protein [Staphylococcus hyicus]MCQ9299636.1 proline dehydrogenase family protein [Staphylococcus hyicus]MCQ9306327.1 proline dehydrogenase family protein [Staphylococcus hyicus]
MGLVKNFFMALSNNAFLNATAKKVGPSLGAKKVVAGNQLPDIVSTIKRLNDKNIAGTVDILGEFVHNRQEAIDAKNEILKVMKVLHENKLDAHMSIKLSQLGIEFDRALAYDNVYEIVKTAKSYNNMHINFDTEKYDSLFDVTQTLDRLKSEFTNVGTVIQAYLFKADVLLDKYPDLRLRLVKGAYKESPHIAYQTKEEIDNNYIRLIEKRLLNAKNFTSIATHDHHIINHVKAFVKENNIDKSKFEFQMLYGFRTELAEQIAKEGYHFTIYVPYGDDWFGYFMRRLAERPQNLTLAFKEFVKPKTLAVVGGLALLGTLFSYSRKKSKCHKQNNSAEEKQRCIKTL